MVGGKSKLLRHDNEETRVCQRQEICREGEGVLLQKPLLCHQPAKSLLHQFSPQRSIWVLAPGQVLLTRGSGCCYSEAFLLFFRSPLAQRCSLGWGWTQVLHSPILVHLALPWTQFFTHCS